MTPKNYFVKKYGFCPQNKKAPFWMKKCQATYQNQKSRCHNSKTDSFVTYGKKGIVVQYSIIEFFDWFYKNMPKDLSEMSVGRINHDLPYTLTNIEFVTKSENSKERIQRLGPPGGRKPVIKICSNTGMMIGDYSSILEASIKNNVHQRTVVASIMGARLNKKNRHLIFAYGD